MKTSNHAFTPQGSPLGVSAVYQEARGARVLYAMAHGAGAGMRHPFLETTAVRLAERGVSTLRYQFPYTEAGRKRPDAPALLQETVRGAVDLAARLTPGLPLVAGGKSMGGRMTSLAAADGLPAVAGLVFLGFPLHAPGKPGTSRATHLERVGMPMLFVQGTRDPLADMGLITGVCDALGKRATLHVVDGGDHSFKVLKRSGRTADEVMDEIASAVATWAERAVA